MIETQRKSGFVALVGRPNVGKSTLVNQLVGQKIAIMSDKPQTTRTRIRGVLTRDEGQIVFLDTPGIHKPEHRLGEYMIDTAEQSMRDVDVIAFVVDASVAFTESDEKVLQMIKGTRSPVILVLNKVDVTPKDKLLTRIEFLRKQHDFAHIVPVSGATGDQVDVLTRLLFDMLPTGPFFYPPDVVTDNPEQFVIAELIREKVLLLTREEIPHSIAVSIEQLEYRGEKQSLYIHAIIYTERDSQKGILIGKSGEMLKRVGTLARRDIENLLGTKAFLELWIKVKKDWRNQEHLLRNFGFQSE